MAKLTTTRLLEVSKVLQTEAGKQLAPMIDYLSRFVADVVQALRGGLTFGDNFACEVKTVSLKHETAQIVSASKTVTGIIPLRVTSTALGLSSFAWYYDEGGRLTVSAGFTGTPGTAAYDVSLVLLF